MTLRTGTSCGGKVYRYYTCSTQARQGKTACNGRSIGIGKLDGLVIDHLIQRLLHPERLAEMLSSLTARRTEKAQALSGRILQLQHEVTEMDGKLKRLYRLIEDGVTDLDDVLKDRLADLKAVRDRANAALERAGSHVAPSMQIDPVLIEEFGRLMRHNLTNGLIPFRKAYLRAIIDLVEVDDSHIRIKGSKEYQRAEWLRCSGLASARQRGDTTRAEGLARLLPARTCVARQRLNGKLRDQQRNPLQMEGKVWMVRLAI
jgi:site-specific DNA recombinase